MQIVKHIQRKTPGDNQPEAVRVSINLSRRCTGALTLRIRWEIIASV